MASCVCRASRVTTKRVSICFGVLLSDDGFLCLHAQIEALDEERREALQANEAAQQAVSEHAEARRAAETDLQNALRDLNLHRQVSELAADKVGDTFVFTHDVMHVACIPGRQE